MKKIFFVFSMFLLEVILLSTIASAYIDPGTGGVLLNTILPLIAVFFASAGAFAVKWFWKPIKKTFSKLFSLTKK